MALRNTTEHYGSIAKCLHWGIVILVLFMLLSGFFKHFIPSKTIHQFVMQIHKSTGILIFCVMLFRLAWTLSNPKPALPSNLRSWEYLASGLMHALLYFTLLIMPLTGWIFVSAAGVPPNFYGLFTVPAPVMQSLDLKHWFHEAHEFLAWTLLALLSLHVLAALKHHFINKNDVLKKMLPGSHD